MTSTEETKLLAMRDYILKLANAISRSVSQAVVIYPALTIDQLYFSAEL